MLPEPHSSRDYSICSGGSLFTGNVGSGMTFPKLCPKLHSDSEGCLTSLTATQQQ